MRQCFEFGWVENRADDVWVNFLKLDKSRATLGVSKTFQRSSAIEEPETIWTSMPPLHKLLKKQINEVAEEYLPISDPRFIRTRPACVATTDPLCPTNTSQMGWVCDMQLKKG